MAHLASWRLSFLVLMSLMNQGLGRNVGTLEWDSSKGYVMYCPCSGRFGNQLEQLLGALHFASKIDRILVIPPFITYPYALQENPQNAYYQVDRYFEMEEISTFYPNVITMENFMSELAPLHWPEGNRFAYCSSGLADNNEGNCMRNGNPFRTFWEDQGITFDGSIVWQTSEVYLHYSMDSEGAAKQWKETYPASEHPVVVLVSAPSTNPIGAQVEGLQHYLKFTAEITEPAEDLIDSKLQKPFWGIHLRNGADWSRTCELADSDYPHLLSSRQCTHKEGDQVTRAMCIHSEEQVITDIQSQMDQADEKGIPLPKSIFVATDHVAMEEELQGAFPDVKIVTWSPHKDQMDLYILNQADHVILNCVSAFSAFVKRYRDVNDQSVAFFGYMQPNKELPKTISPTNVNLPFSDPETEPTSDVNQLKLVDTIASDTGL